VIRLGLVSGLAALALSVGCGGEDTYTATSSDAAELRVVLLWDESAGLYFEGARSYIAVETPAGEERVEFELRPTPNGHEGSVRLDPGDYRLLSWQRPCDGSCDSLDSPTDRCSAPFTVAPETPTLAEIQVRAGEGCTIEVG
jgi:hypothetical protein